VRLLSLRLLAYAGLGDLDAQVTLYSNRPADAGLPIGQHAMEGAAAWFAGIEEDTCLFGAEQGQLDDGDAIVGSMCHEVAHAFRHHHELESTTRLIEEEHTDITTIYLGFGALTLNNTERYRTKAAATGMVAGSSWSMARAGYLPMEAMAYLLAAQVRVREIGPKARRRIMDALAANQRACFEAAYEELGSDVAALCARLGLPPREVWPAEESFELPELPEDAYFVPEAGPKRRPFNDGKTVFRVEESRAASYAVGGLIVGACILSFVGHKLGWRSPGDTLAGAAIGLALGTLLQGKRSKIHCSDPRCEAAHRSPTLEHCPRCGGTIRATLRSSKDRLEAEDTIEAGQSLADLEETFAARQRRANRRGAVRVAVLVGLLAWGAFHVLVPARMTVAKLRGDADLVGAYVRVDGDVIEPQDGDGMTNPGTGETLMPFFFQDGTDKMHVWCDRSVTGARIAKGAHVRVKGRLEKVMVDGYWYTRFLAETVD
jgi:hypothetical protein